MMQETSFVATQQFRSLTSQRPVHDVIKWLGIKQRQGFAKADAEAFATRAAGQAVS